jgi:hypothetical protein
VVHVACIGKTNLLRVFVGKPEVNRPLPEHRSEDKIKMNLMEIKFGGVNLVHVAQNTDQWQAVVEHANVP